MDCLLVPLNVTLNENDDGEFFGVEISLELEKYGDLTAALIGLYCIGAIFLLVWCCLAVQWRLACFRPSKALKCGCFLRGDGEEESNWDRCIRCGGKGKEEEAQRRKEIVNAVRMHLSSMKAHELDEVLRTDAESWRYGSMFVLVAVVFGLLPLSAFFGALAVRVMDAEEVMSGGWEAIVQARDMVGETLPELVSGMENATDFGVLLLDAEVAGNGNATLAESVLKEAQESLGLLKMSLEKWDAVPTSPWWQTTEVEVVGFGFVMGLVALVVTAIAVGSSHSRECTRDAVGCCTLQALVSAFVVIVAVFFVGFGSLQGTFACGTSDLGSSLPKVLPFGTQQSLETVAEALECTSNSTVYFMGGDGGGGGLSKMYSAMEHLEQTLYSINQTIFYSTTIKQPYRQYIINNATHLQSLTLSALSSLNCTAQNVGCAGLYPYMKPSKASLCTVVFPGGLLMVIVAYFLVFAAFVVILAGITWTRLHPHLNSPLLHNLIDFASADEEERRALQQVDGEDVRINTRLRRRLRQAHNHEIAYRQRFVTQQVETPETPESEVPLLAGEDPP